MLATLISLLATNNLLNHSPDQTQIWPENNPIIQTVPYPEKNKTAVAPILKAKAILTQDLSTGQQLYQKNSQEKLPIASLTKLMVAKIILKENSLDEIVTVASEATKIEPSKINLVAGEKITVRDLIKSMIIKSANDSAMALAIFNAGSTEKFVEKMNAEAQRMGLANTHFMNPSGLDEANHYSTTQDLSILARQIYQDPFIQKIAPIQKMEISSTDGKITHQLDTTNDLLSSYLHVLGLKTGTTDLAGQCLITIVENSNGNKILNVMLGSNDRFKETKILSQWIFDSYQWI